MSSRSSDSTDYTTRLLDPQTGTITRTASRKQSQAVLATTGGLWYSSSGGHAQGLFFVPYSNPSRAVDEGDGVGSPYATVTVANGVAWISRPTDPDAPLFCANPDTGGIYSDAPGNSADADSAPTDITSVGSNFYATYATQPGDGSGFTGIVHLIPPAECLGPYRDPTQTPGDVTSDVGRHNKPEKNRRGDNPHPTRRGPRA